MVVVFPFRVVQLISYSEDFDGSVIAADVNFFVSIQIHDKSFYYLYIKENPCIELLEEEWCKIVSLHDMLRREINECIIRMTVYEIAAIYLRREPITQQPRSRNDRIFQQFIFSLFNNFHIHRTLEFYATEQSITPRHLSMVVKQMSWQTAGEWITGCIVINIKSRLQDQRLSIAEISDEMTFPNPSFFSQYFKKYTGMTPREFGNPIYFGSCSTMDNDPYRHPFPYRYYRL